MKTGTFMDIVSVHYKEIRKSFTSRSFDKTFDEDSFNDAFIKCALHFGNDTIDYDYAIKYLFTTYKNTHNSMSYIETNETVDIEECDFADEYDEEELDAKEIYDDVMNAIAEEYSENDMKIYSLYKYHKWKLQQLIDSGYNCTDFENKIKEIHKFAKSYCKRKFGKSHL